MKSTVIVAVLVGLLAGVSGSVIFESMRSGKDDKDSLDVEKAKTLDARLTRLENDHAAVEKDLQAARVALADALKKVERAAAVTAERIANAGSDVAEIAGSNAKPSPTGAIDGATDAGKTPTTPAAKSPSDWILALKEAKADRTKWDALWNEIRNAKQLDEVIALLEESVKADPQNTDAKVDLGNGYLQKTFAAGGGPEAGKWAMKADKSFDDALAIDPNHWEARFTKAVSLSFWPAALGKQGEAIKHFEALMGQQEREAPQAHHAQTYMFLGNLYNQTGKGDRAVETWKKGLAAFPDNAELKKQIENSGAK